MMRMIDQYWKPIEKDLRYYFHELYWKDILALLDDPYFRMNSVSALIEAIRKGTIQYSRGKFTGKFTMKISAELEKFAKYDGRSNTWTGFPPPAVSAAAAVANDKSRALNERLQALIAEIPSRVEAVVDSLKYSIDQPLFSMNAQANKDLNTIGITVDITPELSERIIEDYTNNQNLNIKNWTSDQTERLREMIEKNVLSGYNRGELIQMIQSEYGTTMNKARFLARQETSLLMATVRDTRYSDAGVNIVRWSNSHDVRVVGNPAGEYPEPTTGHGNHWRMGGKYCSLNDPTIYADTLEDARSGKWKSKASIGGGDRHAGEEYNCRCTYIPVI